MNLRTVAALTAMTCLAVPIAGSATASAATPTPRGGIVGKITKLSSSSLQVKTTNGTVTEKLTSSTVFSEVTRDKLSDVSKGTFVTMTLGAGNTVATVSIGSRFGGFRPGGFRPGGTRPSGARRPPGSFAGRFMGGQVVSVGKGKLTLRNFLGKSTTYTLSKNVVVTKSVRTTRSALKVGETVRVAAAPGTSIAFAVTIESA